MKIRNTQYAIRNTALFTLLSLCLLLSCSTRALATENAWLARREQIINQTADNFLHQRMTQAELRAKMAYLHAEAYYLYTQGFYEDAIGIWEEILAFDRNNETALKFVDDATARLRARVKPKEILAEESRGIRSMRQKKLGPTPGQYSHTNLSNNEMKPEYQMLENRFFDHSISLLRNEQNYAIRTKRDTTSISESIRADTTIGEYDSTFAATWNYDDTAREDFRFLRYVNYVLEHDNWRFLAGDNSAYLSRFVMNGMNFRGAELMFHTDEEAYPVDRFKALYGLSKYYDGDSEEYFYPIEVFGVRNEVEFIPAYKVGVSFMHQVHENKITRVDSLFHPKRNIVYSFDQYIKPADWWVIRHEIAYSEVDNEVRNDRIQEEQILDKEDWAHYLTSNILKDKWQMFTVYEYGGPNFVSLAGEPQFFKIMMPNDREMFENTFVYTPTDQLLFELQYYRYRNNLEDDAGYETTKENWFKATTRIMPKNTWMPVIGLKGSLLRSRTLPGSSSTTDKRYTRDFGIELTKTLYGVDWRGGYTFQKSYEDLNYKFCDVYRHLYSMGGRTTLIPDRVNLNVFYSFANLDILTPVGDMTNSAHENKLDASVTSRLWGPSSISAGYHYFNRRDYIGTFEDLDSHTGSIVFNCPYTKEFANKRTLTMSPFLSYYYTKNDEYTDYARGLFSGRLDTSYYFTPNDKLDLVFEYIEGMDKSDQNQEGDEVRFMTTYRSVFGLP